MLKKILLLAGFLIVIVAAYIYFHNPYKDFFNILIKDENLAISNVRCISPMNFRGGACRFSIDDKGFNRMTAAFDMSEITSGDLPISQYQQDPLYQDAPQIVLDLVVSKLNTHFDTSALKNYCNVEEEFMANARVYITTNWSSGRRVTDSYALFAMSVLYNPDSGNGCAVMRSGEM